MSIPNVRDFFGVKYVIPYDRTSKVPKLILRAVGEFKYEVDQEQIPLTGGDTEAPWDVEFGQPDPTLTGVLREYPKELFQITESATVVTNAAESGGSVTTLANGTGTTVMNASNGVSAVAVKAAQKANLKAGRYIFKATASQTLEVYVAGVATGFQDIQGLYVTTVDCSTPGTVDIDTLGIQITVTGTAAFTTGDTAYTDVRPENTGSEEITIGGGTTPSEFGVLCIFPQKTDGVIHYIDIKRVSGRGLPWNAVSREWSELDISWKPLADTDGSVYKLNRILAVTS